MYYRSFVVLAESELVPSGLMFLSVVFPVWNQNLDVGCVTCWDPGSFAHSFIHSIFQWVNEVHIRRKKMLGASYLIRERSSRTLLVGTSGGLSALNRAAVLFRL